MIVRRRRGLDLIAGENVLHTLAEVSIAFAGFSGIVGVFGGGSNLSEGERTFRVRMMIVGSLSAFFGSLLPIALGQFEAMGPFVWVICCPLFATFVVLMSLDVYRRTAALASHGNYSRPWFRPVIYAGSSLAALSLIGATFGLLPGHSIYILAIIWQLALASLQFLLLVLQTKPRSERPDTSLTL
jgi:hypothetical protein